MKIKNCNQQFTWNRLHAFSIFEYRYGSRQNSPFYVWNADWLFPSNFFLIVNVEEVSILGHCIFLETTYYHQFKLYFPYFSVTDVMNHSVTNMYLCSEIWLPSTKLSTGSIQIHNQKYSLLIWITISSIRKVNTFSFVDLIWITYLNLLHTETIFLFLSLKRFKALGSIT